MKKKCVVLGGGVSGFGTAQLAIKHGFKVFVSDSGFLDQRTKDKFNNWEFIGKKTRKIQLF